MDDSVALPPKQDSESSDQPRLHSEGELRYAVERALLSAGVDVEGNVRCAVGTADLVSRDRSAIVEVKWRLTRAALYTAIGQVLLYRHCLNPTARAIIIGYPSPDTESLITYVTALGIKVIVWSDESEGRELERKYFDPWPVNLHSMAYTITPRTLLWNVAQLAQKRGIYTVPELARRIQGNRQGLYAIWRGTAVQVSVNVLARLMQALDAYPGDWFNKEDIQAHAGYRNDQGMPSQRHLTWDVAQQAALRGMDINRLGHRAELHRTSVEPIWNRVAEAVTLTTLGRIALAFDNADNPFNIGDLFRWDTPDPLM